MPVRHEIHSFSQITSLLKKFCDLYNHKEYNTTISFYIKELIKMLLIIHKIYEICFWCYFLNFNFISEYLAFQRIIFILVNFLRKQKALVK